MAGTVPALQAGDDSVLVSRGVAPGYLFKAFQA